MDGQELQEITLAVLIELKNGVQPKCLVPYSDARCRAALYKVLHMLVLCPHAQWPAPLHYASVLFGSGLNDASLDVSAVCAEALVAIEPLLRPRGPTLNFPLDGSAAQASFQQKSLLDSFMENSGQTVTSSSKTIPLAVAAPQLDSFTPICMVIRAPESSPVPRHLSPVDHDAATIAAELSAGSSNWNLTQSVEEESSPLAMLSTVVEEEQEEELEEIATTTTTQPQPKTINTKKNLYELPYGTDEYGDDVDEMLASFKDVPPE